jgi:hypothetical protein
MSNTKEQSQIKQMQAMMGKYLTELSELREEVRELKKQVQMIEDHLTGKGQVGPGPATGAYEVFTL